MYTCRKRRGRARRLMRFSRMHDPRKIPADAQLGDQDPAGSSCLLTFALMSSVCIRM